KGAGRAGSGRAHLCAPTRRSRSRDRPASLSSVPCTPYYRARDQWGNPRMTSLLRIRDPHGHARVTNIELFFDLVFVFAITQIAHSFLGDLTPTGAGHALLMLFAVWWVWIYTSWITNWLDPERAAVRVLLLVLMLAGLVLSASLPEAFG